MASIDLDNISNYINTDMFLFDYKPSKNQLPGGNAKKFDWGLIRDIKLDKDWFLSGGINITNINTVQQQAVRKIKLLLLLFVPGTRYQVPGQSIMTRNWPCSRRCTRCYR